MFGIDAGTLKENDLRSWALFAQLVQSVQNNKNLEKILTDIADRLKEVNQTKGEVSRIEANTDKKLKDIEQATVTHNEAERAAKQAQAEAQGALDSLHEKQQALATDRTAFENTKREHEKTMENLEKELRSKIARAEADGKAAKETLEKANNLKKEYEENLSEMADIVRKKRV